MTKKMELGMNITRMMILRYFPSEYLEIVFGGKLNIDDVVKMAILNIIKDLYDKKSEKHSLRYYYEKYGIDTEERQKQFTRNHEFVNKYRRYEYEYRTAENDVFPGMDKLILPDMSSVENRIKGYKLSEMNFFEEKTILENEFTKSIVEKRLTDVKKVNNERFKEILCAYDKTIYDLSNNWEGQDKNAIFNSIAAFTLEWKYPVHFLYHVAKRMEELGITEFSDEATRLCMLCGDIRSESVLGVRYSTHSRMIHKRDSYIDLTLNEPTDSDYYITELGNFREGLFIEANLHSNHDMTVNGESLFEWFDRETEPHDWASFFRYYNVFNILLSEKKEWTNKRIRYFRRIYDLLLRNPARR